MNPIDFSDDDGHEMPSADALVAGTLALMTGHAESRCAQHKALMTQKVMGNLACLAQHPQLHAHFKGVVARLHGHWARLSGLALSPPAAHTPLDTLERLSTQPLH